MCHCNFFAVSAPEDAYLRSFMTCLLADSVGMFWLITGFYFLQTSNYKKLIISMIKKVMIPGLMMIFVTQFLTDPIINGIPFSESEALKPEMLSGFFIRLVTFRETGVYWYVFAYIMVVLIQPVLFKLGEWLGKSVVREVSFIVITLALLIANDLFLNGICHFSYCGIFVLIPAAIEVMWGHIIFKHRKALLKPVMVLPMIIIGVCLVAGRTVAYSNCLKNDLGSHLISWYTSFGFVMAVIAVLLCMQIVRDDAEHSFDDIIRVPAGYTYPIYLIHPFLLTFARVRGFFTVMDGWLTMIFPTYVASLISILLGFMVFYLASFGIAVLLRRLCNLLWMKKRG